MARWLPGLDIEGEELLLDVEPSADPGETAAQSISSVDSREPPVRT
jgi:hypothetical protein